LAAELSEALRSMNPLDLVFKIETPLMVVVGANDPRTTLDVCRRIYDAANELKRWALVEEADHDFSVHRIPMIKVVLERLKETL
jgi:dipeptidyl aminopeptidase/acylaminoacyl peptidase